MTEALEHLVTVCENVETLKDIVVVLGGETSTDERELMTIRGLKIAGETTCYALRAMREIIHEG